jgi:hypothetical protein
MVNVVGLSLDKVVLILRFFQNFKVSKSQAEALLRQLARHWEKEFENLCTLLANSAVVHADETSWSLKSVWAFLSEKARVVFYGVNKNAATLKVILDPATFTGLVISDDAAVYANFSQAQKCWAHLLRKAIKLALLDPEEAKYRHLVDRLLVIYQKACRLQANGRLSEAGRVAKVPDLQDEIACLCGPVWVQEWPPLEGLANDYRWLNNEVLRLMLEKQLFTFVTVAAVVQPNGRVQAVSGTNNEAEREMRGPAGARKAGRTSKTARGARRQTILTSVLGSLRLYLVEYTIGSVLAWIPTGGSST